MNRTLRRSCATRRAPLNASRPFWQLDPATPQRTAAVATATWDSSDTRSNTASNVVSCSSACGRVASHRLLEPVLMAANACPGCVGGVRCCIGCGRRGCFRGAGDAAGHFSIFDVFRRVLTTQQIHGVSLTWWRLCSTPFAPTPVPAHEELRHDVNLHCVLLKGFCTTACARVCLFAVNVVSCAVQEALADFSAAARIDASHPGPSIGIADVQQRMHGAAPRRRLHGRSRR